MDRQSFRRHGAAALTVALLVGTATSALAHRQPKASESDKLITERVSAVLSADKDLVTTWPIEVQTWNGTVWLSGELLTVPMIYRAVALTREVEGVRRVEVDDLDSR